MSSYTSQFDTEDIYKYLSIVLAFCILFLSISYIYFINSSVWNTMVRQQDDREISQLMSAISSLENRYMAEKSNLNIDTARSLGFKDDFSKVHFSSENTNVTGNLSLLSNEI